MKNAIDKVSLKLARLLEDEWMEAIKHDIETADRRKDRTNPICRKASCVYVAYSQDEVLYVGETSKSVKRWFVSDGDGSHKKATPWYAEMTHVRHIIFDDLPDMHRKLLEQAMSNHFNPKFYDDRK